MTKHITGFLVLMILYCSCNENKRIPPKGYLPNTPTETQDLEAQYLWIPQNKLESSYWNDANYVDLQLSDYETGELYEDGYLNMTGTYNGINSLDEQHESFKVRLKAGYDEEHIYILAEWNDYTVNAAYKNWYWNGNEDILKLDDASGWTSQQNSDNITLLFPVSSTTNNGWKWSMAYTAPFEQAINLLESNDGTILETSDIPYNRNASSNDGRVGPEYEWNGEDQIITTTSGNNKKLDPATFLLDAYKVKFTGNPENGNVLFNDVADCSFCHGTNGTGEGGGYGDGGPLNGSFINRYSRVGLKEVIESRGHQGSGSQYWGQIKYDSEKVNDLLSYMKASNGIPGHTLLPDNLSNEITAISNIKFGEITSTGNGYKVLFIRKLNLESNKHISFNENEESAIKIRLSDNDEINSVISNQVKIIFKSNEL